MIDEIVKELKSVTDNLFVTKDEINKKLIALDDIFHLKDDTCILCGSRCHGLEKYCKEHGHNTIHAIKLFDDQDFFYMIDEKSKAEGIEQRGLCIYYKDKDKSYGEKKVFFYHKLTDNYGYVKDESYKDISTHSLNIEEQKIVVDNFEVFLQTYLKHLKEIEKTQKGIKTDSEYIAKKILNSFGSQKNKK